MKFLRYLRPFWRAEALVLGLNGFVAGLGLVNPYLAKLVIDRAYAGRDFKLFLILTAAGGAVFLLNGIFGATADYLSRRMRLNLNLDLNLNLFKRLQLLPYTFFQETSTGEHIFKLRHDADQASRVLSDVLRQIIMSIIRSALILAVIFRLNWKMASLALSLTPVLYLVPRYFTGRVKAAYKAWLENSSLVFRRLQEILSRIQLAKAFGREARETRNYIGAVIDNTRLGIRNLRLEIAASFANNLAGRVILGLIVFYGGCLVVTGRMTLGTFSAISIYLAQLSSVQNSLAGLFQQAALGAVSFERLDRILELEPESLDRPGRGVDMIFPRGAIHFRDVTFGYTAGRPVLDGLNLSIGAGSFTGIVGPSGCGKTTITNLLLRLYRPMKGGILIDGFDINTVSSRALHKQTGAALQRLYLWDDTIADNIRYSKEDAGHDEVMEAAGTACIHDFIESLPKKYDTLVGEAGCRISEGQKQRIAIARAIINRPRILILDEAFSSIDAETEGRILRNIRRFLGSCTIIVVSHRASTLRETDMVYFVAGPRSVSAGPYEELLGKNAAYRNYLAGY